MLEAETWVGFHWSRRKWSELRWSSQQLIIKPDPLNSNTSYEETNAKLENTNGHQPREVYIVLHPRTPHSFANWKPWAPRQSATLPASGKPTGHSRLPASEALKDGPAHQASSILHHPNTKAQATNRCFHFVKPGPTGTKRKRTQQNLPKLYISTKQTTLSNR